MGRAMFDDIIPPADKADDTVASANSTDHSIRNVTPLETQERETRRARRAERRMLPNQADGSGPSTKTSGRASWSRYGVWGIAILILAVALSAVGFVSIGKTTITIEPHREAITLSSNIVHTAYKESENNELQYALFTHTIEAQEDIPATGRENVEEKASGRIIVYNNHSTAPQRLIKNTRFEAPTGEIYRIRNSIVVPGITSVGAAGSIEVTVFADKAGETQNISALGTKFTIPGLKGDPRYDTFHAELKEPITGGFIGERPVVDEGVLTATRTKLQAQLREQALAAVRAAAPETIELFEGGLFISFDESPIHYTESGSATVREVARIQAVTFDKNQLARMLALAAIATPHEGTIRIDTPENLKLTIVNRDGVDISNDQLIQFTLEGATTLTWDVDIENLKEDLVGKQSSALNTVMSGYPGIKSAKATIRPFWRSEFPSDSKSIEVEIVAQ